MENQATMGRTVSFTVPSGYEYTIREQNGADDDVLSNPSEARDLTNLSRFISGIVVNTNFTSSGKINLEEAKNMPILDRYCILFRSRIFSMGKDLEFDYNWGENGGKMGYTQDLEEFLFDYSKIPSDSEMDAKPDAIPFYPKGKEFRNISFTTSSGKELQFDLMNGLSEAYLLTLPLEKRTKNQELIARNLRMKVGDKYDRVQEFSMFSTKDMYDIRKEISSCDPIFSGVTEIENPNNGAKASISIISVPSFFYPEEI